MADNYHQLHLYITIIEAEHQIDITDTKVTTVTDHITIIADTPTGHIVTIDRIVTIDLTATIDPETDTTIITAADHRAITEIMITIIIQITEIEAIVITEIIIITVQITIAEIIQDLIHDHHINLDHLIIESEVQIIIKIMEAVTIIMIQIEIQITETKVMDEIIITITVTTKNLINDKVEIE